MPREKIYSPRGRNDNRAMREYHFHRRANSTYISNPSADSRGVLSYYLMYTISSKIM